jgi:8-oxo-dGTP diphosphatase
MTGSADLPIRRAAGCVAYRRDGGAIAILLIRDKYACWTLPKGHLEPGESEEQAAVREVCEETAVSGVLGPLVGRITYMVVKKRGPQLKQVAFFLLLATAGSAAPQADEGIAAAEWFAPEAALALIGYDQVREVVARALELLRGSTPD